MARYKARIQKHHVTYEPEWVMELKQSWHRVISRIQNTKATPDQYRLLINFQHAISFECNRTRCELDICQDCRILKSKPKKGEVGKEMIKLKKRVKKKKKKMEPGTHAEKVSLLNKMVTKLTVLSASAVEERERLEDKKTKSAATDLRKVMQEVKVLAQEIRVEALDIQKGM